jgi:hypothetical protein
MTREALPRIADSLYGLEGEEIARAVVAAVRGPILAEAAEALAELVSSKLVADSTEQEGVR